MEKLNVMEQKSLLEELNQGRELANQLKNHIGPIASKETCEQLVEKILSSYDKALAVLNLTLLLEEKPFPVLSLVKSPRSSTSPKNQCHRDVFKKKRNTFPRWSKQVRVCTGTAVELPLHDGYSWRKYGQKDILGATYPRAYYRCTHRHTRGCVATKQVQRSDEDPSIFEVIYRGNHSCGQASSSTSTSTAISNENEEVKVNKDSLLQQLEEKRKQELDIAFQLGQNLKVETEMLDSMDEFFPSFSFPPTTIESENLGSQIFWEPVEESNFLAPFVSPATSESNYFSMSSCQMNDGGRGHKRRSSEYELTDVNSTPTSVTNSPFDLDFSIDEGNFDFC